MPKQTIASECGISVQLKWYSSYICRDDTPVFKGNKRSLAFSGLTFVRVFFRFGMMPSFRSLLLVGLAYALHIHYATALLHDHSEYELFQRADGDSPSGFLGTDHYIC
jgi:hypothetical protein